MRRLLLAALLGVAARAQVPVPRHSPTNGFLSTGVTTDAVSVPVRTLNDQIMDVVPTSTGEHYYTVTAGNTYGSASIATKANWAHKAISWVTGGIAGVSEGMKNGAKYGTQQIENATTWIDEHIAPEFYLSPEQLKNFQRAIQAYRLYRQMEVMAKSWRGSLFKIDLLDIMPVYEQSEYDDFGLPKTGIRLGLKYKENVSKEDVLSANGLENPFIGNWDQPIITYKGPRKMADISFDITASPYQGVSDSEALSAISGGNKFLDQVWFEGVMGGAGLRDGLAYGRNVQDTRMSPKLLKENAQRIGDARLSQIQREIAALVQLGVGQTAAAKGYEAELEFWATQPGDIYDNQVARINHLRDTLVPVTNETKKLESVEHAKDESDPLATNFVEKTFNTWSEIMNATLDGNKVSGSEADGDEGPWEGGQGVNSGPRMVYKANIAFAKATHAAWLEAQAIRKVLHSKIKARSQEKASDGYLKLMKTLDRRQGDALAAQISASQYQAKGAKIMGILQRLEQNIPSIQAKARAYAAAGTR